MKSILIEEAYRAIKVRDGSREVTIPMIRAVVAWTDRSKLGHCAPPRVKREKTMYIGFIGLGQMGCRHGCEPREGGARRDSLQSDASEGRSAGRSSLSEVAFAVVLQIKVILTVAFARWSACLRDDQTHRFETLQR
jgi:hypothetical protein